MASLPKGILRVLAWFDSTADELKALVNDDGRMPVSIDEVNVSFDAQSLVYDGSAWVKSPLTWGFTDTYSEINNENYTSTGFKVKQTTPVPSGYVYVINAIGLYYNTGTCSILQTYLNMGAGDIQIAYEGTPVINVPDLTLGSFPLKEGQFIKGGFNITVQPCRVYLIATGYKMKVNM